MTVYLAVCGLALAQPPAVPTPAEPAPAPRGVASSDWSADVKPGGKTADAAAAFPKALADARKAVTTARDYTCILVRQEKIAGALLPEQTCSLAVRGTPAAVRLSVLAPKPLAGTTTSYVPARSTVMVKHRAAGPDGTQPTKNLPKDDPAVRAATRHPLTGYGLLAVLDRVDGVLAEQQRQHRPIQVLAAEYTFAGQPVTRYEVFADRPTADAPRRMVLCLDPATKLPVRYEAYGAPTPAAPAGEVLEVVSFLGVKLNVGLADVVFER